MIKNEHYLTGRSTRLNDTGQVTTDEPSYSGLANNQVVQWTIRNFKWILLVIMCIQVLKGTAVYQGPYARAHYLWNYNTGLVKRGLIGSLALYLADGSEYRMLGIINFISYLLYFTFLFFLFRFIVKHANTVTKKYVSLLFATCPFTIGMGALLGYFDALFMTILLIAFEVCMRKKPSYVTFFFLLIASLLIHELSIIFVVIPLLFQLWIHPVYSTGKKYSLIGSTCLLCLLFLVIISGRNESFTHVLAFRLDHYAQALATKSGVKGFLEYGDYAIKNNFMHDFDIHRLGLLKGYFPAYGFFIFFISLLGIFQLLQQKQFVTAIVFAAVCYAPLLIIVVAWDVERFICLTSCTAYICYLSVAGFDKKISDQIFKPVFYFSIFPIALAALLTYYPIADFYAESETLISKNKQRVLLQYPDRLIKKLFIKKTGQNR